MSQVLVQRTCAKLRSAISDEAVARLKLTGDLQEMLDALEVIQPVLEEAEMKFFDRITYQLQWLQDIRHAAYRIMDMVDELQDTTAPAAATRTRMVLPLGIKRNSMASKVNELKNDMMSLKRYYHDYIFEEEPAITQWRQRLMDGRVRVPCIEEASAIGRWVDKQRIVRIVAVLLSAATNITQGHPSCTILPIFGLPGSGKTTLALMVFNDDTRSLQEYNFRVWIHVSVELDFHRIVESILRQVVSGGENEEIKKRGSNSDVVGMEHIMMLLHKILNGKKVLLVLDDLWEEDPIQLQLLKSILTFLGGKVDVIVTTSNQVIARKICTIVQPYRLNPLGDDTCWEIIKKLIDVEEDKELQKIGRKIASKCRGVPLAAVEYAGILVASRDPKLRLLAALRDLTKWEKDMEINFWTRSEALLYTFYLSYMSMPPELKLCIVYYCGIFPNGHNIVKDDLVHQWIAHDFIQPSERLSAIEIAEGYITRLLDMSFFQTAKSDHTSGNDDEGAAIFTMHSMVHDYLSCMWKQLYKLYSPYMLVTNCHGKLDDQYQHRLRALHCINCCNLVLNHGSFSSQRSLRVLELKESPMPKLPDSICKLRHLRYLKITEFSGLVTLPEAFGDLTNLFHIDLSGCSGLTALPKSFGDLINLSHVNLSRCHELAEFPEPLKNLGKLVHLDLSFWSCFQGIGKGLGILTNLEHLNLSNPCCHLAQQRSHILELKDGLCKLTKLRYLNLSMCLNPIFYYLQSQEESLQYIQSCISGLASLEHLDLSHNTFLFELPQSLVDLNRLHKLDLSSCIRLKRIAGMKSLKFIALRNCRGMESCKFVVRIVDDDDVYSSSNIVQLEDLNCQELQISSLEKVKSKEEAQRIRLVEKQNLEKLKLCWTLDSVGTVEDSALLGELTPPPNLQRLEVNGYSGTCLPEYFGELTSLQELKIISCKKLKSLPDSIQNLNNLKDLCISDCPLLEKWCQLEENKKMLAHKLNKNNEEHASTSRPEIDEDCRSIDEVEAA